MAGSESGTTTWTPPDTSGPSGSTGPTLPPTPCLADQQTVTIGARAYIVRVVDPGDDGFDDLVAAAEPGGVYWIANSGALQLDPPELVFQSVDKVTGLFVEELDAVGTQGVLVREYVGGAQNFRLFVLVDGALVESAVFDAASRVGLGEVDGDGVYDAVVLGQNLYTTVYHGLGDGTFEPMATSALGPWSRVEDITGDGLIDAVVPGQEVAVHAGVGDGSFQPPTASLWSDPGYASFDVRLSRSGEVTTLVVWAARIVDGQLGPHSVVTLEADGDGGWLETWRSDDLGDITRLELDDSVDPSGLALAVIADYRFRLISASEGPDPSFTSDQPTTTFVSVELDAQPGQEILLGAGGMLDLYLSPPDEQRWSQHVDLTAPGAVHAAADLDADGIDEIIASAPEGFVVSAIETCSASGTTD